MNILDFQKLQGLLKERLTIAENEQFDLFIKSNPDLIEKLNAFLALNYIQIKELPSTNQHIRREPDLWNSIEKILGFQFAETHHDFVFPHPFGDYTLLKCVSKKQYASVYQAQHSASAGMVAVKILKSPLDSNSSLNIRFKRETGLLQTLNHPNIVKFLNHGEWGGNSYFVMEWLEGADLSTLVDKNGPIPFPIACEWVRQTLIGLEYAWEQKVIHRDIKPSNIFLTTTGEIKILDFGLSKVIETDEGRDSITGSGHLLGTFDYIAPEQAFASREVDFRADIYSLGCTLFKLLTGQAPFSQPEYKRTLPKLMAHLNSPFPKIQELLPECPPKLIGVLEKMVAKNPNDRFQSSRKIIKQLDLFCKNINLREHIELKSDILTYKKKPIPCKKTWSLRLAALASTKAGLVLGLLIFLLFVLAYICSPEKFSSISPPTNKLNPSTNDPFAHYKPNKLGEIYNISLQHELQGGIWKGVWSKDLSSLYLALNNGSIVKLDLINNRQIWRTGGHRSGKNQPANTLSLSANENYLIAGGTPNWVECLDAKNGSRIWGNFSHSQKVICSSISNDGTLAITGGTDKTIRIWDLLKGTPHSPPIAETHQVFSVGFLKEKKLLFSATTRLKIRNFDDFAILDLASGPPPFQFVFSKHLVIHGLDYLFSATQDGCVFCHHVVGDTLQEIFCWHDDRRDLAFQSMDVFADPANKTIKMLLVPWPESVKLKIPNSNSFYILTQTDDTFLPLEEYQGHEQRVTSGQFSLDGNYAMTTSLDSTCRFWKVK